MANSLNGIIYAVSSVIADGELRFAADILSEGFHAARKLAIGMQDAQYVPLSKLAATFAEAEGLILSGAELEEEAIKVLRSIREGIEPFLLPSQIDYIEKAMREVYDPHLGIHY